VAFNSVSLTLSRYANATPAIRVSGGLFPGASCVAGIVSHHQVGLRVVGRAAIGPPDKAFQLSLLLLDEADQDGTRLCRPPWQPSQSPGSGWPARRDEPSHNHALLQRGLIANVNHAGDARPTGEFRRACGGEADAVHLLLPL